jgi:hypothetical protein
MNKKVEPDDAAAYARFCNLYAKITTAYEHHKRHKVRLLRRQLVRGIRAALKTTAQRGRLLAILGEATLRADKRLQILLKSYALSKKEGDSYNCFLVADSLAEFFVERRLNPRRANHWIRTAQRLQNRFHDTFTNEHLCELFQKVHNRPVLAGEGSHSPRTPAHSAREKTRASPRKKIPLQTHRCPAAPHPRGRHRSNTGA